MGLDFQTARDIVAFTADSMTSIAYTIAAVAFLIAVLKKIGSASTKNNSKSPIKKNPNLDISFIKKIYNFAFVNFLCGKLSNREVKGNRFESSLYRLFDIQNMQPAYQLTLSKKI